MRAVCLLSGGLDSTTVLYAARAEGYECHALIFQYGQRHSKEVRCAERIAEETGVSYHTVQMQMPWGGSSLTDLEQRVPAGRDQKEISKDIPSTYVPARNSIFLAFAYSFAEAISAGAIFIGANALDYSGYPDCRPEFYKAIKTALDLGTKAGLEKGGIQIKTPLIDMSKADIVKYAAALKVPFKMTWSCYKGTNHPCGVCDSCVLRGKGFREAKIKDPLEEKHEKSCHG